MAGNRTLLQGFEWHTPSDPPSSHEQHSDGSHYAHLTRSLPMLAHLGFTDVWLPPGCKAMNLQGNGYDIYDLWDLGEFDQKGRRSTKWGSREELLVLMNKAHELGVDVIWDTVLSHKAGADATEEVWAVEVDKEDRRIEICPPKKIEAWLRFDFAGRGDAPPTASHYLWRGEHFNGTDWDQRTQRKSIYKLISDPSNQVTAPSSLLTVPKPSLFSRIRRPRSSQEPAAPAAKRATSQRPPQRRPGKGWAEDVDDQNGNNDFLMFSNVDYAHPDVRRHTREWGQWMINSVGVDGFRIDAAQHISYAFMRDWITHVARAKLAKTGRDLFVVGEIWTGEIQRIVKWLDAMQQPDSRPLIYAFDAPLLYHFSHLSEAITNVKKSSSAIVAKSPISTKVTALVQPDLRSIFSKSLVSERPNAAVTVVTNHDTQPGQTSATPMDRWLKPLFYAFMLLRQDGIPCVFWGDLLGTKGPHAEPPVGLVAPGVEISQRSGQTTRSLLAELLVCRKAFAYGQKRDYIDSPTCVGWTRSGDKNHGGCAVIISIAQQQRGLEMRVGNPGDAWTNLLDRNSASVIIDQQGHGTFPIPGLGVSVYVNQRSPATDLFPVMMNMDVYG